MAKKETKKETKTEQKTYRMTATVAERLENICETLDRPEAWVIADAIMQYPLTKKPKARKRNKGQNNA